MQINVLTIVGVGLIGGSIGLAARKRGLAKCVRGVGRQHATLDTARTLGAIDEAHLTLAGAAAGSDVIVFCTPVDRIAAQVLEAAPRCSPGALLTDAGSTKGAIVRAIDGKLPPGVAFVGGHPLAGSEKRGPEHADADLFENRLTLLTPTATTDSAVVGRAGAFWHALGSRIAIMTAEAHDEAMAVTSHLPHLVAAALAGILPRELHALTATGFRDTTRVAAGDPALWSAIFAHNRSAMLSALSRLEGRLGDFRRGLESVEVSVLDKLLTEAKEVRDALGN